MTKQGELEVETKSETRMWVSGNEVSDYRGRNDGGVRW